MMEDGYTIGGSAVDSQANLFAIDGDPLLPNTHGSQQVLIATLQKVLINETWKTPNSALS
jgi:hypothetical protein